ncbi:hypothetical protein PX699_26625 [Sphingobium sp. H39-3-25]|uniref:hypothetical protein n=1 Tax=Sphingobium arseniciresistens TaxID=3030834 RepID=UPI0023B9F5A0|nr:hypothetical protein [Sphingobium arseniciresistens]|tara:strand:+ start:67009 stop:68838 length:1830 start_codon:yes stop_codon:yes gene_type:complete
MAFGNFGRKGLQRLGFGRKVGADAAPQTPPRIFGRRDSSYGSSPFDRFAARLEAERDLGKLGHSQLYARSAAMADLSAEERGELLADLAHQPGIFDGYADGKSLREKAAYNAHYTVFGLEVEVRPEHLPALLILLLSNDRLRKERYNQPTFDTLLKLIDSAIRQGAYLSSGDCEALVGMAAEIRGARRSYRKADTKKMIGRAEKLEKLAGAEVSSTELLMQRCEGADNPWALAPGLRPNARFWADLLAETTIALEEIRDGSKTSRNPAWMRDPAAFAAAWPAVGEVVPHFGVWEEGGKPFAALSQHNGKRAGFAEAEAYRRLPDTIALAQPHSRFNWKSDQIPGLDVLADLENPDWTALVEQMITQRRATRATATWQKEIVALCRPIGIEVVEARLHDWLALFHTPTLDRTVYTDICNGERFAATVGDLEETHPDWPSRHGREVRALGRAVAMVIASQRSHALGKALHTQLIRTDDHVYKNTRVTDGVLGLARPHYKQGDGRATYESISTWMRVSIENEEFLRGATWLVALMPDRSRAIDSLSKVAQSAATYLSTGEDGMRSKIIANAAIATLIAMGGSDIDQAVLHLSKMIENCTINPPLFKYLNAGA